MLKQQNDHLYMKQNIHLTEFKKNKIETNKHKIQSIRDLALYKKNVKRNQE